MVPPTESVHQTHVSGIQILYGSQKIIRVVSSVGCYVPIVPSRAQVQQRRYTHLRTHDAYSKRTSIRFGNGGFEAYVGE